MSLYSRNNIKYRAKSCIENVTLIMNMTTLYFEFRVNVARRNRTEHILRREDRCAMIIYIYSLLHHWYGIH